MRRSAFAVMLVFLAAACSGGDTGQAGDTGAATAAATPAAGSGAASCLPGTWTQPSPSFSPKFVFNADGTGSETVAASQGGETRNFTWAAKGNDKVTITFPSSGDVVGTSTDWNVNCEGGTFASMYKKQ